MGADNLPGSQSSKQMQELLAAQTAANDNPVDNNVPASDPPTTKKTLGYADGYAQYTERYGGLTEVNGESVRASEVTNDNAYAQEKSAPLSKQVNTQVNNFRNIFGYNNSDSREDPTFIIFDLYMDYIDSPLFNNVNGFFSSYSDSIPELSERPEMYSQFVNMVQKIFPGDLNQEAGYKRHYINSIGGLDLLFKKIVTYPEDVLTFTLSEDVTMLTQYMSELYSNLVYSYDTHRYLIPDNLLRFNLTIMFRDARDMVTTEGKYVNQGISKFAYVLHDCQFDFFNSRNFGNDVKVSGFDGGATTTPASLTFSINYKSYSKITGAQAIDNAIPIDLRERLNLDSEGYERFSTDYNSLDEQKEKTQLEKDANAERSNPLSDGEGNVSTLYPKNLPAGSKKKTKGPIGQYTEKLKNSFTDEISDVRNVLINKVKEEVTVLSSQAQRFVSDKLLGGLDIPGFNGITLSKVNVYYDDPFQAINKVSFLFEKFLDNAVDDLKNNVSVDIDTNAEKGSRVNIYWDEAGDTFGEKAENAAKNAFYGDTGPLPRNSNLYGDALTEGKAPSGESRHEDGSYNEKEPTGDLHEDGEYNEKYPEGIVQPKGEYNEKYPDGDLHEDGQYNLKFPGGDVHEDGTYNEKYPDGDVHEDGSYNEKYPDGDTHEDGTYNEKYPDGDVHEDGTYNEKEPSGSVQEKGTYNEKYPSGDVHPDGQYNLKFPDGDVQPDGEYNQKYPTGGIDGDLHEDGEYHDKEPKGEVYSADDLVDGVKKPSGNVYGRIEEVEPKEPEGDVHPGGEYHDKEPKGNLYKKDDNR